MNGIAKASLALVIVGALNWLLVGLFQFDLVATIFGGSSSLLARVVYCLVGLAGLYCISLLFAPTRAVAHSDIGRDNVRRVA